MVGPITQKAIRRLSALQIKPMNIAQDQYEKGPGNATITRRRLCFSETRSLVNYSG